MLSVLPPFSPEGTSPAIILTLSQWNWLWSSWAGRHAPCSTPLFSSYPSNPRWFCTLGLTLRERSLKLSMVEGTCPGSFRWRPPRLLSCLLDWKLVRNKSFLSTWRPIASPSLWLLGRIQPVLLEPNCNLRVSLLTCCPAYGDVCIHILLEGRFKALVTFSEGSEPI